MSTDNLTERLDQIEKRAAAATPGPWGMFRYRTGGGRIHISGGKDSVATAYSEGDREFLLAVCEDVPWLIEQLCDALAENERLRNRNSVLESLGASAEQIHKDWERLAREASDLRDKYEQLVSDYARLEERCRMATPPCRECTS